MHFANDFGLATQERHWLFHIEQLFECVLCRSDVFCSELLKPLLGLAIVQVEFLEEEASQSNCLVIGLSGLDHRDEALEKVPGARCSQCGQLRFGLLSKIIVCRLESLEQPRHRLRGHSLNHICCALLVL